MNVGALTKKVLQAALFYEIWDAMKVTFQHMFHRPMTLQYPREQRTIPDTHRGALGLLRYDDGHERCVGCDLCEAACPSRCIKVISAEDPTRPLQRYATEFYIDITKCVFCGYCVEACPVNALAMTKMYEFSTHDKRTCSLIKRSCTMSGNATSTMRKNICMPTIRKRMSRRAVSIGTISRSPYSNPLNRLPSI